MEGTIFLDLLGLLASICSRFQRVFEKFNLLLRSQRRETFYVIPSLLGGMLDNVKQLLKHPLS